MVCSQQPMGKNFDPLTSDGFVWRDPEKAAKILWRFKEAGSQLLHVVSDWDGTITPETGTTWHVMRNALPPDAQQQHRRMYAHYKGLQDAGKLTSALEREWSNQALALHVENRTPLADIRREAAKVKVRPGAWAVFNACEEAEVPSVVLSAGVGDVITAVARRRNIRPTRVVATELERHRGRVAGWRPDTMVDSGTKMEMGHPDLSVLRELRPHAVLLGDQPHDARMIDHRRRGLRIRVDGAHAIYAGSIDRDHDPSAWQQYLDESWAAGYHGVSVHDNLLAVAALTRWLIGDPEQARALQRPDIPAQRAPDSGLVGSTP